MPTEILQSNTTAISAVSQPASQETVLSGYPKEAGADQSKFQSVLNKLSSLFGELGDLESVSEVQENNGDQDIDPEPDVGEQPSMMVAESPHTAPAFDSDTIVDGSFTPPAKNPPTAPESLSDVILTDEASLKEHEPDKGAINAKEVAETQLPPHTNSITSYVDDPLIPATQQRHKPHVSAERGNAEEQIPTRIENTRPAVQAIPKVRQESLTARPTKVTLNDAREADKSYHADPFPATKATVEQMSHPRAQPVSIAQNSEKLLPTPTPTHVLRDMDHAVATSAKANVNVSPADKAPPPAAPVMQQTAMRIAEFMTTRGAGNFEVALLPEELGRLRIVVSTSELGISFQFSAERPETLDILRRNIAMLESELELLGKDASEFAFSQDFEHRPPSETIDFVEPPDAKPGTEQPSDKVTSQQIASSSGNMDLRI